MENRLQHIFLICTFFFIACFSVSTTYAQSADFTGTDVDSEFLELGLNVGIVNIEDFPSEFTTGLNLTFRASEDYFLQLNLVSASDVALSSVEKAQGSFDTGSDRDWLHYDMLVGFNFFQGEFFTANSNANLSTLYIVGGIGETEFGDESNFTYTYGMGYKVAFNRRFIVTVDIRDYLYKSSLINPQNEATTTNTHVALGLNYLF